jgi:hypothetical protein
MATKAKQTDTNENENVRIPMMLPGQALQSLRDAGFDFAAALGEVIDNSIEAKANDIRVRLDEDKVKGKNRIVRVIVSDDGTGMDEDVLHHYMQLGYSTRFMRRDTIGKYGVGAKLAALNFAEKIDVWSRTDEDGPWMHITFDLQKAIKEEKDRGIPPGIDQPEAEEVPSYLTGVMPKGTGTVVVWSDVDRLEEGRVILGAAAEIATDRIPDPNELRVDVEKELSRIFRYFLEGRIRLSVNDKALLPHDPLFLMEGTWSDKILTEHLAKLERDAKPKGGDEKNADEKETTSSRRKKDEVRHFPAKTVYDDAIPIGTGSARVRVTVYPAEVVRERFKGGDELAHRLRVPENMGRISFMRLDREINYNNVPRIFPRGVEDPDRFIGIEVAFTPELDEYFGVRHVKRGVEPHGQFRAKIREVLKKALPTARDEIERIWGLARPSGPKDAPGKPNPLLDAAKNVDRKLPKGRVKGNEDPEDRQRVLDDLARDVVGEGKEKEGDRQKYLDKIQDQPFVVEPISFPGSNFMEVEHLPDKIIVRLNTRHRFYREVWEPIEEIAKREAGSVSGAEAVRAARRTVEALTLMLISYGKAESMDNTPRERYGDLRMFWGQFLDSLMSKVKNVV